MKVGFLSSSLSRDAGGIFEIELALAKSLARLGLSPGVFGLEDTHWPTDKDRWNGIKAQAFPTFGPKIFGYSPRILPSLLNSDIDILHLHTMWMYTSVAARKWGKANRDRLLVTPNGMLEPWALKRSKPKKMLAGLLYERSMLKSCACLQANTQKELKDIRRFGLKNPVCVIPNGVELCQKNVRVNLGSSKKILLFLGRLHPKKGLENALRAWRDLHESRRDGWIFVIAGWDQGGHGEQLKELCSELKIPWSDQNKGAEFLEMVPAASESESQAFFPGPFFGSEKESLLQTANAFILPSFSEGLPMAVLEAWASELPVILTKHCNLETGLEHGAAISVEPDPKSIAHGLEEMFSLSDSQRTAMGQAGQGLVANDFSWDLVANEMKGVYEWILGGGPAPSCVAKQ